MAAQIDPARWYWTLGLGGLAAVIGLLAGVSPKLAIATSIGLAFLLLTLSDLMVGLTLFTTISFLGLTSVASGVGLAKIAGFALAISWLAQITISRRKQSFFWVEFPSIAWLLVAFIGWACLSLLWAESSSAVIGSVFRYLLGIALFPIVFTALNRLRDVRAMMGAFVVGATISAVWGVISTPSASLAAESPAGASQLNRLSGTVGDPNLLASVLVVGTVLAIALALTSRKSSLARLVSAAAAALCLLGVLLTFSRGGLLCLGIALVVAPFFARRKAAAIAGALAIVLCVATYIAVIAPASAREHLIAKDGGSGRTDIWAVGWRVVEAHPVVGVGTGNFPASSIHYVIKPGTLNNKKTLIDEPSVAHNVYLEILAELGVVGLALFGAILLASIGSAAAAVRSFKQLGDNDMTIIAGAVVVSLASLFGADYFLSEEYSKQLWLLLAIGPALLAIARSRIRAEARTQTRNA